MGQAVVTKLEISIRFWRTNKNDTAFYHFILDFTAKTIIIFVTNIVTDFYRLIQCALSELSFNIKKYV